MQVGFRLIDTTSGAVVQSWGGAWGQCPGFPNPLVLPNGDHVVGGGPGTDYNGFRVDPWYYDDLPALKTLLASRVDADAGNIRQKFISTGVGMELTYSEKFAQAQAVHALGEAAATALSPAERVSQFPTLDASVGIEAATIWDCAQLVLAKYTQFAALSHVIERIRLQGKKNISAATDIAAAQAAYEAISWTTVGG